MPTPPPADDAAKRQTASFSTRRPDDTAAARDAPADARPLRFAEERFHILHLHAEGGLGAVWMADDSHLRRQVALKEIRAQHADDPHNRARFLQEAEITGRLEHPGIVPVYALGERGDGRPYYVMRFIRGTSMQKAIAGYHAAAAAGLSDGGVAASEGGETVGGWTLRQLLGRFVAVCEAVAYAHSRGVLHRDLKPDNVMLGNYGETLVVDWGLAKPADYEEAALPASTEESAVRIAAGSATRMGSAIGTPGYMSPEQARGQLNQLSPATDVYSLGATLYCLLTGRPPIQGRNTDEILQATGGGEFPSPREVARDVPRPLESIVLRALALEPRDRYASALELAQDVERYLDDLPVLAHRDSLWERSGRWLRRHRSGVAAGGIALILVAGVSLAAAAMIARSRDQALELAEQNAQLADAESRARQDAQLRQQEAEAASQQATAEQQRAEHYYALAIRAVDDFLTGVSDDERLKAVGLEELRRDLLVQARDFYELVIAQAQAEDDPLYERRAHALERLGNISQQVGDYDAAIDAYRQSLQLIEAMPARQRDAYSYYVVLNDLALTLHTAGKAEEAAVLWQTQIDGLSELLARETDESSWFFDLLATGQLNLARLIASRSLVESIEMTQTALDNVAEALRLEPENDEFLATKALLHNNLANVWLQQEEAEQALEHLQQAQQIWQELRAKAAGGEADNLDDNLGLLHLNLAAAAVQTGDDQRAMQEIEQGLRLRRDIADRHPEAVEFQARLADLQQMAGTHYRTLTRYDESLQQFSAAIAILTKLHEQQPGVPAYRAALAEVYIEQAMTQLARGAMEAMLESLDQASGHAEALSQLDAGSLDYRWVLATSHYYRGIGLIEVGEAESAYAALKESVSELGKLRLQRPRDVKVLNTLSDAQGLVAAVLDEAMLNRPAEAFMWWMAARATTNQLLDASLADQVPPSVRRAALINRAEAQSGLGSYQQALDDWNAVIDLDGGQIDYEVGVGKATTLFYRGDYGEALATARQTAARETHPALIVAIAREISVGVAVLAESNLPVDSKESWQEAYAAAAIEMLDLAREMGYFNNLETIDFLTTDPYLEPLQERGDFRAFVEQLEP